MEVRIEVEANTDGLDTIKTRLKSIDKIVSDFAKLVVKRAVLAIETGTKSGRTYRRGAEARWLKTGGKRARQLEGMGIKGTAKQKTTRFVVGWKFHRASAPGEAPATDEGNLVNTQFVRRSAPMEWVAGFSAKYAARLEERMNRPYLRPALESVRAAFIAAIEAIFKT